MSFTSAQVCLQEKSIPKNRSSASRDSQRCSIDAPDQPHRRVRYQTGSNVRGNVDG